MTFIFIIWVIAVFVVGVLIGLITGCVAAQMSKRMPRQSDIEPGDFEDVAPETLAPARDPENLSICVTDPPRVVELKREFYRLCERQEDLRPFKAWDDAKEELQTIDSRKAEIGREIFGAVAGGFGVGRS